MNKDSKLLWEAYNIVGNQHVVVEDRQDDVDELRDRVQRGHGKRPTNNPYSSITGGGGIPGDSHPDSSGHSLGKDEPPFTAGQTDTPQDQRPL